MFFFLRFIISIVVSGFDFGAVATSFLWQYKGSSQQQDLTATVRNEKLLFFGNETIVLR